jgi:hypothetical protein
MTAIILGSVSASLMLFALIVLGRQLWDRAHRFPECCVPPAEGAQTWMCPRCWKPWKYRRGRWLRITRRRYAKRGVCEVQRELEKW